MKTTRSVLVLAVALLLALPAAGYDDEDYKPPEAKGEGHLDVGYQDSDTEGNPTLVAQYNDIDANVLAGLKWTNNPYATNQYLAMIDWTSADQNKAKLGFDFGRTARIDFEHVALPHRLDHDPLYNLQAVSTIKVVRSTDLEPGAMYQLRYSNSKIDGEFLTPSVPGLSFLAGYRMQTREGRKQSLHTGHCSACHTTAQGRDINQKTRDATVGVNFSTGAWDFNYTLLNRSFVENAASPVATFETPFRPAPPPWSPTPDVLPGETLFTDRLWFPVPGTGAPYDSQTAVYDVVPETERIAHNLKIKATVRDKDALNLTFVQSSTTNENTSLSYDFQGVRGRYTWVPGDKLRINFIAKRSTIENDSVFIDLPSLWGGGPYTTTYGGVGTTTFQGWREWMAANPGPDYRADPQNFDNYTRYSSLNRTENRLGVDVFWRPLKRGSFRGKLTYKTTDRDNVILADGSGKTTSTKAKLGWNMRFGKRLRWFNTLVYETVDNPYINQQAARRAFQGFRQDGFVFGLGDTDLGANPGPTPKNPYSMQYYQLQQYRVANLTNVPNTFGRFRTAINWSPSGRWSLGGNFKYRRAENDELNYSTYARDNYGLGANFWIALGPKVQLTLAADMLKSETDAYIAVPLMDG